MAMTPEIAAGIAEIREAFPGKEINIKEESNGDVYLLVHDLEIGGQYTPCTSWVGFKLGIQYPYGDVYPHYIDRNVRRSDGTAFTRPIHINQTWPGYPDHQVTMVSRRSNRWNPATDTAALKLAKVLDWIRKQ